MCVLVVSNLPLSTILITELIRQYDIFCFNFHLFQDKCHLFDVYCINNISVVYTLLGQVS